MGFALIVVGLLVWLLLGAFVLGIVLVILGVALLFVPAVPYGVRGRRAPP
jgi:hypothetical protein